MGTAEDDFRALKDAYRADMDRLESHLENERRDCLSPPRLYVLGLKGGATAAEREHLQACGHCAAFLHKVEQSGGGVAARGVLRRRPVLAVLGGLAAALAIGFAALWVARGPRPQLIADMYLSSSHLRESRGELSGGRFRSGERVYVHATFPRPVWALAARLAADGGLHALGDVVAIEGGYHLFFADLDEATGTESILVLAITAPRSREQLERLLREVEESAPPGLTHEAALERIKSRMSEREPGIEVRAETFLHLPR